MLHKIGATAPIEQMLKDAGIEHVYYDKVAPNPTIEQVRIATDLLLDKHTTRVPPPPPRRLASECEKIWLTVHLCLEVSACTEFEFG